MTSPLVPTLIFLKPCTAQLTSLGSSVHTPIVTLTIVAELDTAPNHSLLLDKIFAHVCCFENPREYGNTYLLWPNQEILVWFSEYRLIQTLKFLLYYYYNHFHVVEHSGYLVPYSEYLLRSSIFVLVFGSCPI